MIFKLFTCHSDMERYSLALFALLSFTIWLSTDKSVFGIMLGVLLCEWLSMFVFFRSIIGISLNKLILLLAFAALDDVHQSPDSFVLHLFEFLIAYEILSKKISTLI